jgi:hypothetical protein
VKSPRNGLYAHRAQADRPLQNDRGRTSCYPSPAGPYRHAQGRELRWNVLASDEYRLLRNLLRRVYQLVSLRPLVYMRTQER